MFVYDFSFRSLTAAQDGRSVLQNAGVFSQLALRADLEYNHNNYKYQQEWRL